MKRKAERIKTFILFLIFCPVFAVLGIMEGWADSFETFRRRDSVCMLLFYGALNLGVYDCGIQVVCRNEVIYEADEIFPLDIPSEILRMRVHTWDFKDGRLWVKVTINERLLAELKKKGDEKR